MLNQAGLLSFIRRSKNRKQILKLLSKHKLTTTDIEKQTNMYKSHISRALKELDKEKLVQCLNPKDRAFRYYKITAKGSKVLKYLDKLY